VGEFDLAKGDHSLRRESFSVQTPLPDNVKGFPGFAVKGVEMGSRSLPALQR